MCIHPVFICKCVYIQCLYTQVYLFMQLQEKEEKHLKLLVTEQQKRENERESQLRKKVEEYSRLEKEFKSALSEVRTQQDQLREKEYKV